MERKSKNAPFKLKSAMKFVGMGIRGGARGKRRIQVMAERKIRFDKLKAWKSNQGLSKKMQA